MKTVTETYKIYTINELREINKIGYENAIEREKEIFIETCLQDDLNDMQTTLNKIVDFLNIEITDYSYGLYNYPNYVDVENFKYLNLDNASKNEIIKKVNEIISKPNEFDCDFTGIYTDFYFIKYFEENKIDKVTFNDLHKHFDDLFNFMIEKFINDLEDYSEDEQSLCERLNDFNIMFKENGKQYKEIA